MTSPATKRPMKPEIRWALVYRDGTIKGITQPDTYGTRAQAREKLAVVHGRHRNLCRIARVIIKEHDNG